MGGRHEGGELNTREGERGNHKVHIYIYIEYHSACPLVRTGILPPPLSPTSVPLPPEPKSGGHILLRVMGWGVPIPATGEKLSTLPSLREQQFIKLGRK